MPALERHCAYPERWRPPGLFHMERGTYVFAERDLGEDLVQPLTLRRKKLRISVS